MKYVSNKELQPGMCVARPITGEDGQVLLNSGVILNELYRTLVQQRCPRCLYLNGSR